MINFDAPEDRDAYVHRTGRTGRAGASGVAASFILPDQDYEMGQVAKDLGLHQEFAEGRPKGLPHGKSNGNGHAARKHSGNGNRRAGGASGKSFSKAKARSGGGHGGQAKGFSKSYGSSRRRAQPQAAQPLSAGLRSLSGELHALGLVELDLPQANRVGGHLDALVLAQELEGLL